MGAEQTGGKRLQNPIGDPQLPTDTRHSYEAFTERPFYVAINRQTVQLVPDGVERVLDIATGTGGIIKLLIDEEKLGRINMVVGIDLDTSALQAAAGKFSEDGVNVVNKNKLVEFEFKNAPAESTGERDNSFDVITNCNAVHLMDVPASFTEAHRVLKPGGTLIINSAFVDGVGYPTPEAAQLWSSLGRGAIKKAMKMDHRPTENPKNYFKFNREEYEGKAREAGFQDVETSEIQTLMDIDDVLAICHYDEFATGALPGVPLDIAHQVLTESAIEVFNKLKATEQPQVFPRGWMVMRAVKPMALAA